MALDSIWNPSASGFLAAPPQRKPAAAPIFGARPPSSPSGLANSYKQAPPERLDVNSIFRGATGQAQDQPVPLQALEAVGRAPGFIYERPIATLDTLAQRAGLGSPAKGVMDAVGGIPILGPLIGGLGDVVTNISNFLPAVKNAGDIDRMARIPASTPDSALLRDFGRAIDYHEMKMTVGELRAQMRNRGFTDEDIAGVRAGRLNSYDFGDHPISDSPLADVAFRLVGDPLNLVLGAGLLTKAARGVGLLVHAEKLGYVSKFLPLPDAIAAVATGSGRGATWAGVAGYMGSAYRTAAIRLTAGELAIQTVGPSLAGAFEDTPASGFLEGLNEVNKAVMDNRPLSNNMIFTIWSAFHFPVVKPIKQITNQVGLAVYNRIGSSVRPAVVEALTDHMPKSTPYAERLAVVHEGLGGQQGLEQYTYHMMGSMLAPKIPESLRQGMTGLGSLVEAVNALRTFNSVVVYELTNAFKRDLIHGRDVVAFMKENHAFRRDPAGGGEIVNKIALPWNGRLAMQNWSRYSVAASTLSKVADDLTATLGLTDNPFPTIGLSGVVSKHDLSAMQAMMRTASEEGFVPAAAIEGLLNDAPQLMKLDTTGFWERQLLPGAPAVKLDSIIGKLGALKKNASTLRDITHEFAAAEAPVSHGLPDARPEIFNGAAVSASRYQASLEGWGIKRTISDAVAERARPEIQAFEHNIGDVLEQSGIDVTRVVQVVGTYERAREPAFRVFLNSGSLALHQQAAALIGEAGKQQAVLLTMSARQAVAQGVKPNGVTLHWTLPSTETKLLDRVAEVMDAQFDGWTLADGKIDVALHRDWMPRGYGLQARLAAVDKGLRDILPGDVVGDRGIIHTTHRAYVEMIDRENYANVIAAAGSDPRVAAFNGLKARLSDGGAASRVAGRGGRAGGLLRERPGAVGGGDNANLSIDPGKSVYDSVGHGAAADLAYGRPGGPASGAIQDVAAAPVTAAEDRVLNQWVQSYETMHQIRDNPTSARAQLFASAVEKAPPVPAGTVLYRGVQAGDNPTPFEHVPGGTKANLDQVEAWANERVGRVMIWKDPRWKSVV